MKQRTQGDRGRQAHFMPAWIAPVHPISGYEMRSRQKIQQAVREWGDEAVIREVSLSFPRPAARPRTPVGQARGAGDRTATRK